MRSAPTWDDLGWLVRQSPLPVWVKGVLHPDDARRAVDAGVDGIIVSNHGGRQVDGAISTIDALDAIAPGIPVTWFVRVDNQIADIYGRPGHLLETHRDLFERLRARGDEIAWHPHLYRRKAGGWEQETDDAALLTAMRDAIADMRRRAGVGQ